MSQKHGTSSADYSSPRLLRKLRPEDARPSCQAFFLPWRIFCATVTRIGRAIIVEILHPTASCNYTKLAKSQSQVLDYPNGV